VQLGDTKLESGDVAAARTFYQRAAQAGNGAAAAAIGRTFDPNVLARMGPVDIEPNPPLAAFWYRKALALGDRSAEPLLRNLHPVLEQPR